MLSIIFLIMVSEREKRCLLRFRTNSKHIIRPVTDKPQSNKECYRNEFQIDRDRILYSKAFRRLMHKTQVSFIGDMNEHIRTRLTHTLEVVQISRTIARCVGANEDLTEAIALGHDVGHTPFGHVGEFFLNDLLNLGNEEKHSPENKILKKFGIESSNYTFGFKHNYQSVRVLMELEGGYTFNNGKGLNISYPVLEGIIKHSSIYFPKKSDKLIQYHNITDNDFLFMNQAFSASLEGQIVNLADEIAQKCHDIEDAIEGDYDTKNELNQYLMKSIPEDIKVKLIDYGYYDDQSNNILKGYTKGFVSVLLSNIVESSVRIIRTNIEKYSRNYQIDESVDPYPICEDIATENILVENAVYKLLDTIQRIFIISCYKADREEEKARYILRQIVRAYLTNPKQVRDFVINRYNPIFFEKESNGIFKNPDAEKIFDDFKCLELANDEYNIRFASSKTIKENRNIIINNPIFVRLLCDYIASMTDLFAFEEYKKLYLEKPI